YAFSIKGTKRVSVLTTEEIRADLGGKKSYTGPCGGRDCSAGCKCFPEKGARVSLFSLIQLFLVSLTNLGGREKRSVKKNQANMCNSQSNDLIKQEK
uniref:Uncharacterized protein n=1 Tax=Cairina moschata TaxID=8855 RepID=A0A8C3C8B1_CAIMO